MLFTSSCTSIDLQSRTAPSFRSLTSSIYTNPTIQGITGYLLSLGHTTVIPGHLRWCSTLQIVDQSLGREATPIRGGFFPSCIFLDPERRGKRLLPKPEGINRSEPMAASQLGAVLGTAPFLDLTKVYSLKQCPIQDTKMIPRRC